MAKTVKKGTTKKAGKEDHMMPGMPKKMGKGMPMKKKGMK